MIGCGALDDLGELLAAHCRGSRFAIVADASVAKTYAARVARAASGVAPCELLTFPAGEWNKSRESWAELTDQLLRRRFDGETVLLSLGGGVALDLGGFVAATYRHGIDHVRLPTTLLAMTGGAVRAGVGVDSPAGRDLIGTIHDPRLVVADVATLATLPPVQVSAGVVPAIQLALAANADDLQWVLDHAGGIRGREGPVLEEVVRRSVELNRDYLTLRRRQGDSTRVPLVGDSIGHALRMVLGYELLYGESVALGMLAEAVIGHQLGVTGQEVPGLLREAIELFHLPDAPPRPIDASHLIEALLPIGPAGERCVRLAVPAQAGALAQEEGTAGGIAVTNDAIADAISSLRWT